MTTQSNAFAALMTRLGLDDSRAAAYLGVPVYTFRKWASGERTPSASVLRLLEVLGMVEAMAPAIHEALVPVAHVEQIPVKSDAHVGEVQVKSDAHVGEVQP